MRSDAGKTVPFRKEESMQRISIRLAVVIAMLTMVAVKVPVARAEESAKTEVYGFVMTDVRYDKEAKDPDWFDVMRPTKLPAVDDAFGKNGNTSFSARQTRFGIRSWLPTSLGELKTTFEWELFGVGVDAGQTTFRLRHAYGELGHFGAGQTWSPFMDIDVFPNSVEYWGPNGMAFFRNVQARWMPIQGDTRMTIAIERPGASADAGNYADRVELSGVVPRFPVPDLSAEYRMGKKWGYVELAGIVRRMEWDDTNPADAFDDDGGVTGWGVNLSSNIKFSGNVLRLQALYGEGVENYMNDAPVDVATKASTDPTKSFDAEALPVTGLVAFLDHTWNPKWSTAVGWSYENIDNSEGQAASAFHVGNYALVNAMYTPVPNVMLGPEVQWINRENKGGPPGGFDEKTDNLAFQFSFKYNFSTMLGGGN